MNRANMQAIHYPQFHWVAGMLLLLFLFSCKKDESKNTTFSPDIFYRQMATLTLEVAYEPGAEPYDFSSSGANIWEFAEMNIESLFVQRPVRLDAVVPRGINAMRQIPAQNQTGYTAEDILNLATRYRSTEGTETDGNIFVLFLDGYFMQDDTLRQSVAGVHLTGTTVTAVFKPLVTTSHVTRAVREFVEQSIVIHETGHVLGLVNNGVRLTTAHEDLAHEAHCTNANCVMYWANERSSNVALFVQSYFGGSRKMIFGSECAADVTNYFP